MSLVAEPRREPPGAEGGPGFRAGVPRDEPPTPGPTPEPAPLAAVLPADPPRPAPAVELRRVTKRYGRRRVVDGIDLAVPRGSVFGLFGADRSGRTATLRLVAGLVRASRGRVELLGHALPRERSAVAPQVGALVGPPGLHPALPAAANLRRLLRLAGLAPTEAAAEGLVVDALARLGLDPGDRRPYRQLPAADRQLLGVAAVIAVPRALYVLDEPTAGLDVEDADRVRAVVRSLVDAADGAAATVLLATGSLAEIEAVCSHVAVLDGGRVVGVGSLAELAGSDRWIRLDCGDPEGVACAAVVAADLGLTRWRPVSGVPGLLDVVPSGLTAAELTAALAAGGCTVRSLTPGPPSLSDSVLALTGTER
ncbi:MAG: multidrug transporter ATP-binding protein [Mycobacterium sp.]|nr:multidrug transporter ATP-binding protein [Mycobacterium sp.]